jgi:integrase/recombinase XerC
MTHLIPFSPISIKPLTQSLDEIISGLLDSKNKSSTRRTYKYNIKYFADFLVSGEVKKGQHLSLSESDIQKIIAQFFQLSGMEAIAYLSKYQSALLGAGYAPNSVNIKIASIKSLVNFAERFELCNFNLSEIKSLPSETYKDTTGINNKKYGEILKLPDQVTVKGKRDYALLRLLWDNALRRAEISDLDIQDFNGENGTLAIKSKGKYSKEVIYLAPATVSAIQNWLSVRTYKAEPEQPLFVSLSNRTNCHRLTGKSIYCIVRSYADEVLTDKILSPQRVRHSSITAVLDASNGNVRMAQKLSRHKSLDVLTRYDDNRVALQKEAVNILADLV